jgi:hypothetical protein
MGYAKHGLQSGEKGSTFSKHQACMKQLSVEALDLSKSVSLALTPFINAGKILTLFRVWQCNSLGIEIPAETQVWND